MTKDQKIAKLGKVITDRATVLLGKDKITPESPEYLGINSALKYTAYKYDQKMADDTLTRTIEQLCGQMNIGIMEADIDSDVDAERISDTGVKKVIQLHTGGMCHLDADMSRQGLEQMGMDDLDLVVLENVGNLVCPAEFDTGAAKNAMILSVPEGHDKPLKYPLIFQVCDALIINKIDVLPYFDFDMDKVVEFARMRNPNIKIFPISAKTGEGVEAWCDWLREQTAQWNS